MKMRIAVVAALAALGSMLVTPAAAHAAPDELACSAGGSYSRVVGGVPKTFWLIGTAGAHRYWQVTSIDDYYLGSYVVRCTSGQIAWSADLVALTVYNADRCGTTTTSQYRYVGSRTALLHGLPFPTDPEFKYWHVYRWVNSGYFGLWTYDHSEVVQCPTAWWPVS
jgi:hypothetical protein